MKLQYLGDSKDCFKWDYHDFLLTELNYQLFNIALMMTPPDKTNDGKSHPTLFPARKEVIEFCNELRQKQSVNKIKLLPIKTGSSYHINFHNNDSYFSNQNRYEYFLNVNKTNKQVIFLDPDNGFEPEKSINEKHVSYNNITQVLEQISDDSVISVFQHHRRKKFYDDFSQIRKRIEHGYSVAIYWHSLMFVSISKSEKIIKKIKAINSKYAKLNPVEILPTS
jgi:hypothetical protein